MRLSEIKEAIAQLDAQMRALEDAASDIGLPELQELSDDPDYAALWDLREQHRARAEEMEGWVMRHCRPPANLEKAAKLPPVGVTLQPMKKGA